MQVVNFGGNVRFTPRHYYTPRTEQELLDILNRHADGKIRVVASLHSWSDAIVCDDVIVNMRHFDDVEVSKEQGADGSRVATIGGGCRIKRLLDQLDAQADCTLPALGAITEQTVAGAISTGTHGSGRSSMSHYVHQVRVAAYDPETGAAAIQMFSEGDPLRAARCSLGCLGVIVSVQIRCVPKYFVAEVVERCETIEAAVAHKDQFPLTQFVLIPYLWSYYVLRRREVAAEDQPQPTWLTRFWRLYTLLGVDVGLHVVIKVLASPLCGRWPVHLFFRRLFPLMILKHLTIVDHSEKALVLKHELFRHIETELFVPASHLPDAATLIREVTRFAAGYTETLPDDLRRRLEETGLVDSLIDLKGAYVHHYPYFFRRVLPDDTLISMASGGSEDWYSISIFTYAKSLDGYMKFSRLVAKCMADWYGARPHWGKINPLEPDELAPRYPRLERFREVCCHFDAKGVFRNRYVESALGFHQPIVPSATDGERGRFQPEAQAKET